MRAFVTGGNGFVGSAVVRHLLAESTEVRVLVRAGGDTRLLDGLPVEIVTGDLADREALRRGCEGCDEAYHVAALFSFWGHDWDEFYATNVDGTRNALQAAWDAGVPRIVHTSSIATLGQPQAASVVNKGQLATVWGTVKPRVAPGSKTVKLNLYRYSSGEWRYVKTYSTVNGNYSSYSKYQTSVRLWTSGSYRFKAIWPESTNWARSTSAMSDTMRVR